MRVLHLINTLSAGGAELHLLTLCRHLKQYGVEVVVACLREQVKDSRSLRPDFEKETVRVVDLQADSRYEWRFFSRVAGMLKEEHPDILHTHLPRADLAGAFGHFFYPSVAWVSSVHGIYSESWSARWMLPLFDVVWRRADVVLAISQAVKDWLVKQQRVLPTKVAVIHYGIEPERFSRASDDLREKWYLDERTVIGSLGRLEPGKGYECLIQAIPSTLKRVPNACLLIAGHDPWGYGKSLQALIDSLGLKEQVRIVGFQKDVASFIHTLDVFAFASRSEGFGQVVIEAMAAAKPVVATKIPPVKEIIVDNETGLLVDTEKPEEFARAISWLLTHRDKAQQMGMRGQERVLSHFSAEKMVSETLSLYCKLVGEETSQLGMKSIGGGV